MRLIDADALPRYTGYALSADDVANAVENAPTIDAVPVVHGTWIGKYGTDPAPFCSVCGRTRFGGSLDYAKKYVPYCQYCGAKMDGVT